MSSRLSNHLSISCRCGNVRFEVAGKPIVSCTCYCTGCQAAGRRFEQLASTPPMLDADGGTGFLLYRKDRTRCITGHEQLKEYRLKPDAPNRRVLAVCCNSAMFLEFKNAHWLSLYRSRFADGPPLEMRVMTKHRRAGVTLANDVPNHEIHSVKFMWRLFAAWAAMGFRVPRITYVRAGND